MKLLTTKMTICLLSVVSIWSAVSAATLKDSTYQDQTILIHMISDREVFIKRINTNDIENNNLDPLPTTVRRPWKPCVDGSCSSD